MLVEHVQPSEALGVRINMGRNAARRGELDAAIEIMRSCLIDARYLKDRQLEAWAWSNLGVAYYRTGDTRAADCFARSDSLAEAEKKPNPDVLFVNAYYAWKIAGAQNPSRARAARSRMRFLRSSVEATLPEAAKFDAELVPTKKAPRD